MMLSQISYKLPNHVVKMLNIVFILGNYCHSVFHFRILIKIILKQNLNLTYSCSMMAHFLIALCVIVNRNPWGNYRLLTHLIPM